MKTRTFITVIACAVCALSCQEEAAKGDEARAASQNHSLEEYELKAPSPADVPYSHPLQNALLIEGKVPTVDVHSDSQGRRFALDQGGAETGSGNYLSAGEVKGLDVVSLSPEEREWILAYRLNEGYADENQDPTERMGPQLTQLLQNVAADESIFVSVWLTRSGSVELIRRSIERDIGLGRVSNHEEFRLVRADHIAQRIEAVSTLQDAAAEAITAAGATIVQRCSLSPCMGLWITPSQLAKIKDDALFRRFNLSEFPQPEENYAIGRADQEKNYGGQTTRRGHQLSQFLNDSYDGRGRFHPKGIPVGVFESGPYDSAHWGFFDWGKYPDGPTAMPVNRVVDSYSCDELTYFLPDYPLQVYGCGGLQPPSYGDSSPVTMDSYSVVNHAMSMSGIIGGDTTSYQDSDISPADSLPFSGFAPEAELLLASFDSRPIYDMHSPPLSESVYRQITRDLAGVSEELYHRFATHSRKVPVVNISQGDFQYLGSNCAGSDTWSRSTNELFEYGVLPIKSAGNTGADGACTITNPGSAIGAFVVGDHEPSVFLASEAYFNGPIAFSSAQGGGRSGNRSIVDIAAIGEHYSDYRPDKAYLLDQYSDGTSGAAAMVTAAAVLFVDYFRRTVNHVIDDPGILHAALLLMGDRTFQQANDLTGDAVPDDETLGEGFHARFGAGRLKMRRLDRPGLDAPAEWHLGRVCVGDREVVRVPITDLLGGVKSPQDYVKAVAWQYDRRHPDGYLDDIDIRVVAGTEVVAASYIPGDEKSRVFVPPEGLARHEGEHLFLELIGVDVGSNWSACGENSAMVYYASLIEDDAREAEDIFDVVEHEIREYEDGPENP